MMLLNILSCSVFLAATIITSSCEEAIRDKYPQQHAKFLHSSKAKRDAAAPCEDSIVIINPTQEGTKINIKSKTGKELLSTDDSKISFEEMNSFIFDYEPVPRDTVKYKPNITILKQSFETGGVITLLGKNNSTIFQLGNESGAGKLNKIESVCVRLTDWQFSLDEKMEVNKLDRFNHTALLWATRLGSTDSVKNLIEKGANVNGAGAFNLTPIHYAAAFGLEDIMKYLIKHGANISSQLDMNIITPLHLAAARGSVKAVRLLIESGADVNVKTGSDGRNSPLHLAAMEGHLDVAKELISRGADLNAKNKYGRTPLHLASQNGKKDLMSYLVQSGADVNAKDNEGSTPLSLVIKYVMPEEKQYNIVEYLIRNFRVDINAKDIDGLTAQTLANMNSYYNVEKLLRNAANIQLKNG